MKLTLITTVLNEEKNLDKFFNSLFIQTLMPDEVIIVDGGSSDKTFEKIQLIIKKNKKRIKFKLLKKIGNRSVGRNFAIKNSSNKIILATDLGCVLDKNWIKKISSHLTDKKIDVVSGYYQPTGKSIFKKCLGAYTSVMPDKINEKDFLPSSRSVAFRKDAWRKVGGYPEWLDTCEDLVFAKKMKSKGLNFKFEKEASVFWEQKSNLKEAFRQLFNYAKGDGKGLFIRKQLPFLYLRYFLAFYLIFICFLERSVMGIVIYFFLIVLYLTWAIYKNYKYVRKSQAFFILPSLQLASDIAVLLGTTIGFLQRVKFKDLRKLIKNNMFLVLIIFIYFFLNLLTINYGIPNINHPFPYHMDEWHQLQAVRSTYAYGTPNVEGSANGTMLHFILSGFYLAPFTLIGIINPFEIRIDDLIGRQNIFFLLRLNTIIWGILSTIMIYKIASLLKLSKKLSISLFTFSPVWLMLSGYFKYDISLIFCILLSFYFIFRFYKNPSNSNLIYIGIPIGLAISIKISVLPLIPIYFISFLIFGKEKVRNLRYLLVGIIVLIFTAIIFGFTDTLFGRGNIYHYFYENLVLFPAATENLSISKNIFLYVFLKHYSIIFGPGLFFIFIFSTALLLLSLVKSGLKSFQNKKIEIFILFSTLLFFISLITLKAYAGSNRALVLLPFMVFVVLIASKNFKKLIYLIFMIVIPIQIYFALAWINVRNTLPPQEEASVWIEKNIYPGTVIGLENIPIYQNIPDILQKEFYMHEYGKGDKNKFKYLIVDMKSKNLPPVIVIINDQVEGEILRKSSKQELVNRLNKEKYVKVKIFKNDTSGLGINDQDFTVAGLISNPTTISVYIR